MYFNPRTREGCDEAEEDDFDEESVFQSTHPRGVRPITPITLIRIFEISIHAPARGATPGWPLGGKL